jgi:uncharacterized delta-60 repeat protein
MGRLSSFGIFVSLLAACGGSGDFSLTLVPGAAAVVQNGSTATSIDVTRDGFDGDVTVALADPPAGVSAASIVIPGGASAGTLEVRVDGSADTTAPLEVTVSATSGKLVHTRRLALTVRGVPGTLDTALGGHGQFTYGVGGAAWAVAVQADGKIVEVGNATNPTGGGNDVVARFNPDGSRDPAFNGGSVEFLPLSGTCNLVALQSDGKILVGGTSSDDHLALARLMPDGSLDSDFGTGGVFTQAISYVDVGIGLAVQGDGKIVIGSDSRANGGPAQFTVVRLDTAGALDASFGTGGIVQVPNFEASSSDELSGLALQSDGKIVLAGSSDAGFPVEVVRLDVDGSLDRDFDTGGYHMMSFGYLSGTVTGKAVQVDANGNVLVLANSERGGGSEFAVARILPNGRPDASFGVDGLVAVSGHTADVGEALTLTPEGGLVIVGAASNGGATQLEVTSLTANGQPDPTFGGDGQRTVDLGSSSVAYGVAVQADGKLVLAGEVYGTQHGVLLARVWR